MRTVQEVLDVQTPGRGMQDISIQLAAVVDRAGIQTGLASAFCQHTSCSLLIMENADPTARQDLEAWLARVAPDGDPRYEHASEGPDDMSAHLRMALTRTHETIPVAAGRLLLGTWQGLFLCEHRTAPHRRRLIITVCGS